METGVKLTKGWYGHQEGKELWDLDAATMAKLVLNKQAVYITRQPTGGSRSVLPVEPIAEPDSETEPRRKK